MNEWAFLYFLLVVSGVALAIGWRMHRRSRGSR